jgi:hypothetical protein
MSTTGEAAGTAQTPLRTRRPGRSKTSPRVVDAGGSAFVFGHSSGIALGLKAAAAGVPRYRSWWCTSRRTPRAPPRCSPRSWPRSPRPDGEPRRWNGSFIRVGVPQYEEAPVGFGSLFGKNVTLTGGPAPVRAYIEELLPEVLDGRLEPRRVFDRTVFLDDVPAGYRAMDDRESIEVLVAP